MKSILRDRVWSVRYNAFHDNFLLSAGSDGRVLLSNVASLSSEAPTGAAVFCLQFFFRFYPH